ncbi:MAG: CidA/LrgA family protein [Clostridiales bacterium]|jgi:holin-like protein|nr:CidA/LrgA family protein [Bacillota bacterium]NLL55015.1 CidA/LrgA family protein [Clostridiales bacterium]
MKRLVQFVVILGISFVGEVLDRLIPLPIPGSIYGMVLLFLLLAARVLPLGSVRETAHLLIKWMPLMFIPALVGVMDAWGELMKILVPVLIASSIVTFLVMGATGWTAQWMLGRKRRGERNRD